MVLVHARAVLAGVVAVSLVRLGHAQPRRMRPVAEVIQVAASADACLDHHLLAAEVESWLGQHDVDVAITVEVRGHGDAAALEIRRVGEPPVTKTFDMLPAVCRARRRAVSLAIALAIEQTLIDHNVLDAPPTASSVALPPAPRSGTKRLSAQVGGAVFAGVLPQPAFAAAGGCGLSVDDRTSVRALGLVTEQVEAALTPGTIATRLIAARLDGCFDHPMGVMRGAVCAGVAGGVVTATGHDLDESRTTRRPWAGAQLRLATRFPATEAVSVQLAVEGMITLLRPRVHVEDADGDEVEARTFPSIGGGVSLELVVDLL